MKWYTSDTHFNHERVIGYSGRPFNSTEEMDEQMIKNWNARVQPNHDVYHLGDFAFSKNPDRYLCRLNGRKHLIIGNHDAEKTLKSSFWTSVQPYLEVNDNKVKVILCHYAMRVFNKSHYGSIMLYGHSHGSLPGNNQSLDVGVDCWDFRPISLEEIQARLKTLPEYGAVDHHLRQADKTIQHYKSIEEKY